MRLAHEGRLTAADIDPATHPQAALALLDRRAGRPGWARLLAADPDGERRARLAACPGLPPDVVERLAADPDVRVVAELAWWATPEVAARALALTTGRWQRASRPGLSPGRRTRGSASRWSG
ncbi:hypothetical protein [Streptomyces cyaneofuscatus]|uniref:hypothetical protein n=1 Tax=Streptomyces cyaneofuscatus TaxID=66883 RepID=UPI003664066C